MNISKANGGNKLKSKDFISLGIFSVLFIIICFVGIFASSVAVVTQPFGIAIAAVLGGTVYMYLRAKVNKFGGTMMTGILLGLVMLATGAGWVIAVCAIVGGILAELLEKAGGYNNYWLTTAGYAVFMTVYAAGSYAPMVLMKDEYYALAMSNSVDNSYMLALLDFYTGPILIGAMITTAACAVVGSLIAKAMMKKHFSKAGLL